MPFDDLFNLVDYCPLLSKLIGALFRNFLELFKPKAKVFNDVELMAAHLLDLPLVKQPLDNILDFSTF